MTSSPTDVREPLASGVRISDGSLHVDLLDGRALSVPLAWFPRLAHGTDDERAVWQMVGSGQGIHWPRLDEDISVEGLLAGRRSGESPASIARWLDARSGQSRR